MTNKIFFDTDCLSSFLWVNEEEILFKLYFDKIVISKQVYDELSNPCVPYINKKIKSLIAVGKVKKKEILINTKEGNLYYELIFSYHKREKAIGKGEASIIALTRVYDGIIASNNLKDIMKYVNRYQLKHLTTADILLEALKKKIITEKEGNKIWEGMLKKKRKLPDTSFSDYLENKLYCKL